MRVLRQGECNQYVQTIFTTLQTHLLADLGWVDYDSGVPLAGGPLLLLPTAEARWWNIPNLSQPNQGPRADVSPCRLKQRLKEARCTIPSFVRSNLILHAPCISDGVEIDLGEGGDNQGHHRIWREGKLIPLGARACHLANFWLHLPSNPSYPSHPYHPI